MKLIRDDFSRWILQKNIRSKELFVDYLKVLKDSDNLVNYQDILSKSKKDYSYRGRSDSGSVSTMGVRMSQVNFYMFGYRSTYTNEFFPTPISEELLKNRVEENKLILGNLFMMQFPHPNSLTPTVVDIFFGRLIVKLLLDEKINKRLYTDELIYILPFVTKIDEFIYDDLLRKILEFRSKSFSTKKKLFSQVDNYDALFAKITHEIIYYFVRIFIDFEVFEGVEDRNHNNGNLFKFRQGSTKTFRRDAIKSRGKYPGYIKMNENLETLSKELLINFPYNEDTYKLGFNNIFDEQDLYNDMYITQSYKLLNIISPELYVQNEIVNILEEMRITSINSPDGKAFEMSLYKLFREFDEALRVSQLSGSGKTDVYCVFNIQEKIRKFNVEAKSGSSGDNVNVIRIMRHLNDTNGDYCLMIAPRFSRGTNMDIASTKISTITTETLYQYCMSMLTRSSYRELPYKYIDKLVVSYPGQKIDYLVEKLMSSNIS